MCIGFDVLLVMCRVYCWRVRERLCPPPDLLTILDDKYVTRYVRDRERVHRSWQAECQK
jgi:hypothetical protein